MATTHLHWAHPHPPERLDQEQMQGTIDRLSQKLSERYIMYLEALLVEFVEDNGGLEFRCGFTLRRDHQLRTCRFGVPSGGWSADQEQWTIAAAVFEELEHFIDEEIAEHLQDAN